MHAVKEKRDMKKSGKSVSPLLSNESAKILSSSRYIMYLPNEPKGGRYFDGTKIQASRRRDVFNNKVEPKAIQLMNLSSHCFIGNTNYVSGNTRIKTKTLETFKSEMVVTTERLIKDELDELAELYKTEGQEKLDKVVESIHKESLICILMYAHYNVIDYKVLADTYQTYVDIVNNAWKGSFQATLEEIRPSLEEKIIEISLSNKTMSDSGKMSKVLTENINHISYFSMFLEGVNTETSSKEVYVPLKAICISQGMIDVLWLAKNLLNTKQYQVVLPDNVPDSFIQPFV